MAIHVHIGVANFSLEEKARLCQQFVMLEEAFDLVVPPSRRANKNHHAKSNSHNFILQQLSRRRKLEALGAVHSFDGLCRLMNPPGDDRYFKLNLLAFHKHETFEFRQHAGTTDFIKTSYWVRLLVQFWCRAKALPPDASIVEEKAPREKLVHLLKHVVRDGALTAHFLAGAAALDTLSAKVDRVNRLFSTKSKVEALKEMCENLSPYTSSAGIPSPRGELNSITKCREYLGTIYINIFDYVDASYTCTNAKLIFKSKKALLARCRQIGFFPTIRAKSSTLKFLLNHVVCSSTRKRIISSSCHF
eukprot:CAMPEP_0185252222 /NCGR_PEP_ID=MMETSP1359-20130426/1389_1 /TAXON_ID=552665 /ORGANISM="Bigelowiella longifila, Strain CCMP242" /LENGTH=303 /DNA_ID=CAMNT_0027834345 /DNA_START=338 /DNA_END=1249 /DNA_ORIENTATION=-